MRHPFDRDFWTALLAAAIVSTFLAGCAVHSTAPPYWGDGAAEPSERYLDDSAVMPYDGPEMP